MEETTPIQETTTDTNNVLAEVTLSDSELIEKCEDWITKLCHSGGKAWSLRVPVDFNNDPDVLFTALIKRYKAMQKRVG